MLGLGKGRDCRFEERVGSGGGGIHVPSMSLSIPLQTALACHGFPCNI